MARDERFAVESRFGRYHRAGGGRPVTWPVTKDLQYKLALGGITGEAEPVRCASASQRHTNFDTTFDIKSPDRCAVFQNGGGG